MNWNIFLSFGVKINGLAIKGNIVFFSHNQLIIVGLVRVTQSFYIFKT